MTATTINTSDQPPASLTVEQTPDAWVWTVTFNTNAPIPPLSGTATSRDQAVTDGQAAYAAWKTHQASRETIPLT